MARPAKLCAWVGLNKVEVELIELNGAFPA